jgi:hypothetical protein
MNTLTDTYLAPAEVRANSLKIIALFFGLVLGALACMATYGLDLSPGLF